MTKRKLRKSAEINHPQSPHDGIHTCSKGCSKPGCNRTLRDTIEEQDKQIEALKRDLLEKTAELRKSEEHNEALCERMQDLNSELFAASNINGKLHMNRVHDLNQMGEQCEEIARLKAEVERLTFRPEHYLDDDGEWVSNIVFHRMQERLKAEVERLTAIVGADAIDREHGMCCDASAQVERLTKALEFSNSLAKGLYEMVDLRMSKKDLIGIGFTKEQADAEWEAYRAAENAAKGGKQS